MSDSDSETRTGKPAARKKPAKRGKALTFADVPEGAADRAAAKGGDISPVDSAILGTDTGKTVPAEPKERDDAPVILAGEAEAATVAALASASALTLTPVMAAEQTAAEQAEEKPPAEPAVKQPHHDHPASAAAKSEGSGFLPLVLGGALAAGLGAAAAIWLIPQTGPDKIDVAAIRAEAVAAARSEISAQAEGFKAAAEAAGTESGRTAAQAALNEWISAAPDEDGETSSPSPSLDPRIDDLKAQLEQQAGQIAELLARPALDPEMAERVQTLADQAGALEQQIAEAAEQAQATISAAQAEAQKLQDAASESTRRAEAVVAVAALQAALDQGVSPEPALENLRAAGVEPPASVTAAVPTLAQLREGFDPAARASLRAALRADAPGEGAMGTIGNFLRAQTGARSVKPREGSDPDAVLSRARAAVANGDITAALTEIHTLPDVAKATPAMAEWMASAQSYADAHDALDQLSGEPAPAGSN